MINTFENNLNSWLSPEEVFLDKIKPFVNFNLMNDDQIVDEYKEIQYYNSIIDKSNFYGWGKLCKYYNGIILISIML